MNEQELREKTAIQFEAIYHGKIIRPEANMWDAMVAEALSLIKQANYVRLADVLEAIKDEPEFPGDMPDELWDEMNGNREICTRVMQNSVRLTKQNIIKRIEDGLAKG